MFKGQKKYYTLIKLLRSAVNVYFGQFLVFYFFTVANYDIGPIALYYIFQYTFLVVGFFFIRHAMKSNHTIPYYRIGLALMALYLAMIMILKENIIHFSVLAGIIAGLSEGFYHFPNNIMTSTIITNEERKKYNGFVNVIQNAISIILPLVVGYFLTYFSYVEIAKVVFCLMIISFLLTYGLKKGIYQKKKIDLKGFFEVIKRNNILQKTYAASFLSGFSFSAGALGLVVTIFTIFEFKTNLNLGIISSIFAVLTCLTCYIFGAYLKEKNFKKTFLISSFLFGISVLLFGIFPGKSTIIFYNLCNAVSLTLVSLIFNYFCTNLSSDKEIAPEYRTEYFFVNDLVLGLSRVPSFLIVFLVITLFGIDALQSTFYFFSLSIILFGLVGSKLFIKK